MSVIIPPGPVAAMTLADIVRTLPGARINPIPAAMTQATPATPADMRGLFSSPAAVRLYMEAGRATLTVVSRKTSARYTFKFSRPQAPPVAGKDSPIWVRVGGAFIGTLFPAVKGSPSGPLHYVHSRKSPLADTAPPVAAAKWLAEAFTAADPARVASAFAAVEVWHEGTCGRCGRQLTVPASIASGFGPECILHVMPKGA